MKVKKKSGTTDDFERAIEGLVGISRPTSDVIEGDNK